MGYSKNMAMECESRGYNTNQSLVCRYCIGNEHLSHFVLTNGERHKCSFCGRVANCLTIETLCGEIMEAINMEYEDANNCMGFDEGEYVGADTWYTYDLLNELNDDMQLERNVIDAVYSNLHDKTWCERDPYGLREHEEHHYLWEAFCDMVKYKMRYVFFRMPESSNWNKEEAPHKILDHIGKTVFELGLFKTIKKGTSFYRGRTHIGPDYFSKPDDLSSPPNINASANRMSAVGISVFYSADNTATVLDEIVNDSQHYASVAEFRCLRELIILDLTTIRDIEFPSLFDKKNGQYREQIAFLYELEKDLTRSIKTESCISEIEYVPTQVFAEYFRFLHQFEGKPVDGIAYRSTENNNGICYVLFFDQKQCLIDSTQPDQQQLIMIMDSVEHYKLHGHWEQCS